MITKYNLFEKFYNKELNQKFWIDFKFNEKVREKLLIIAEEFYKSLELKAEIKDIILTGSIANFNWNDSSDLDVHIVIDFKDIDNNIELVQNSLDGQRFIWNLRHDIYIKGHEIELYIQDINEKHKSSGIYSLLNNKWIIKPKYNPPKIDNKLFNFKYNTYKDGIEQLCNISKLNLNPEEANYYYKLSKTFKEKIIKSRKNYLEKEGEFSIYNLIFKKLRTNGYIEKLIKTINLFYDKIYSQK
jgi:predicted nucleotidyltransferase